MEKTESFTYFISSNNKISGVGCYNCDINIGPVGMDYDTYLVECTNITLNTGTLDPGIITESDYYFLVADNLAEHTYNTYATGTNSFNSSQIILGAVRTHSNANECIYTKGTQFIVKNLKQVRRINFKLYDVKFTEEDGSYTTNDTIWTCTLLFTPLK